MRSDKLQNAIGGIDPDLIIRSEGKPKKKHGYPIVSAVAAILALTIGMGIFVGRPGYTVCAGDMVAVYPQMASYPSVYDAKGYEAWKADQKKREDYFGEGKHMNGFIRATAPVLLSGDGENLVYSPVNIYMALAMLAETTDGNTQRQLLNLLGASNIKTLRKRANAIWNANYNEDGITSSILASSLWLDEEEKYFKETLEILRDSYYASSYRCEMGSREFEEALQTWLNEQTRGLLEEQIDGIELPSDTVLALATTVYFRAAWESSFNVKNTSKDTFHGTDGDTEADFMNLEYDGLFFEGENFFAVSKKLEGSGNMWFILPDGGVSVNELLQNKKTLSFLADADDWNQNREAVIHLSVPKFDISSQFDLEDTLKTLGVTDCFDTERADFSPLIAGDSPAYVGKIDHGVSVGIDEKGIEGAAYTLTLVYGTGESEHPEKEVFFTADRPFLFAVTGEDGTVVFLGVVNRM